MGDPGAGGDRKAILAWCLYDWANSAFTTLVVTFIYGTYFTQAIAPTPERGTTLWSWGIGASALAIAALSPLLGAAADRAGQRRRYLLVATLVCVVATAVLTIVRPGAPGAVFTALALFVVANVAFELGIVFYNAFLPGLAPPGRIGRISGYGWGLGYAGGLLCMVAGLAFFVQGNPFGLSTEGGFNVRATNLLVAGWFLVFSLPLFLFVKEDAPAAPGRAGLAGGLAELRTTVRQIRRYREVVKFLVARLIYNDGLVTVFAFGGIYAAGTFGMEMSEVIQFGIALNLASGLGAVAFGFLDDRLGGKATVMLSLVALSGATLLAVLAPSKTWIWVAGIGIGIFVGPNQSASRSLMGRFVPERHKAEFFGFFAFSGKVTSFLGPIFLGFATQAFGSQRAGVATVLAFFLVGGLLLAGVNEGEGIRAASEAG